MMEGTNTTHHQELKNEQKSPPDFSMTCATPDPCPGRLSADDKNNMNNEIKNSRVELESSSMTKSEELKKVVESGENVNKTRVKSLPLLKDTLVESYKEPLRKPSSEVNTSGDAPKRLSMRKGFQMDTPENASRGNSTGELHCKLSNNNNYEDLIMTESKAAFMDKLLYANDACSWKRERGPNGDCNASEDFRLQFPWKRIAYIGVLLVLGVTCFILALMKLCGSADWMNTATFAVIIMGTVMLLPPGLYYARILICISCRCKGYTLWDVPAGPFG